MMEQEPKGRLSQAYYLLFQAMTAPGLEGIVKAANKLFDCPVLITDQYFQVTAMYPNAPIGEKEWDYIFQHKQLNRQRVWNILDEFLSGKSDFYEPFYANTGSCSAVPRIFAELVEDNTVCGHVLVFLGKQPLREEDFQIVSLMLDAARIKIESRIKGLSNWTLAITTKLETLLDPKTPPHLQQLACEALALSLTPEYAILVTPIGQRASQKAFAEYAVSQLNQMYRNVISVIRSNAIVTLFGEVKPVRGSASLRPEMTSFIGKLYEFFERHDLRSGLSNRFSDLNDVYISYRQGLLTAKMALVMDIRERAVFMDFMPIPIFLAVLEKERVETFVHPALPQLKAYDKAHTTDYYQTMRVYSMTMHNKDLAADKLAIHKNTLQYRLTRIGELFELPFEDESVALNLLCSFLLLELGECGTPNQLCTLLSELKD